MHFKSIPFRFLLYTEWVMIASCGSLAVVEGFQKQFFPVQHILILLILGLMGGMIPKGSLVNKILFTAIEIGLIFYGTFIGYLHILPTLYLIVIIRSCFLFETVGRWVVVGLTFILYLVSQVRYFQTTSAQIPLTEKHQLWMHQLAEILVFGLGIFLLLQLVNTLLREREKQDQLGVANEQLKQYSIQMQEFAAIQERNHIAREIHDSLGHVLTALSVQLQTARRLWCNDPLQAEEFLQESQKLSQIAMKEVRRSVKSLRADSQNQPNFKKLILSLIQEFSQSTGLVIYPNIAITTKLPSSIENTLYRILQESLTNICKHAQSSAILVLLQTSSTQVKLEIKDDGKGFALDLNPSGFGLRSMKERVAALKGTLQIETQPNAGCKIIVAIPLPEEILSKTITNSLAINL